jgi:hypothetical protein
MDMEAGARGWRIIAAVACLPVILAAFGCTQEVHPIGPPEVRLRQERRTTVAASKILRDGEQVGSLRTVRVQSASGERVVHQVRDLHMNSLGFIDEKNCAYRLSAHAGSELVANSSDRRRNVAAILGAYGSNIELIEEEPAAAVERTPVAPGSRPAR